MQSSKENVAIPFVRIFVLFILTWQSVFRIANVSTSVLFRFLYLFLNHITAATSDYIKEALQLLPDTFAKAQKFVHLDQDDFDQYVCCPKCHAIYQMEDCIEQRGSQRIPKLCSAMKFPRHPRPSYRGCCKTHLLKHVKTNKKELFKPIKTYCYKSVVSSLTDILSRPGMLQTCEHWRHRLVFPDLYSDIYDGSTWKQFESTGFFSQPHSYGLMLNVDWLEPFEHSIYAVGVIYLSLLNLPRQIRYSQENIIICGLIPGPKEPSGNINSFLEPLLSDLLYLWRGKEITLASGTITIRAALLCLACDSPAMRKVAGFMSHAATKGCFRCHKSFPCESFGSKPDYSGFNQDEWILRTHRECFEYGMLHEHAKTAAEQHDIEKKYGICYTTLLNLPYYNAVDFCIIDPMHNMLLGSAKTFIKMLKEKNYLTDFEMLQKAVDQFVVPAGIGRFSRKIEAGSGFNNLKAEEWKNWILIFSLICFKPVLSSEVYSLWFNFTQACALVCSRVITGHNIQLADHFIHRYCCLFETLFGRENCYPNLHLHCHLKQCLLDYGPASSFWLFGFERMNGMLGNVHTNNKAVEVQFFRKFVNKQHISTSGADWPDSELTNLLKPLLTNLQPNKDYINYGGFYLHILSPFDKQTILAANSNCKLLPYIKEKAFSSSDHDMIHCYFASHFGDMYCKTLVIHRESSSMMFNGDLYAGYFSRQKNNSLIIARNIDESGHI